ncbi:F-box protein Pof11 [Schizosaccharomyces cryophilus OY26]|uniref:F-box protein Pof11 n=1 Tax=Schizosaccharomyces cryophilus (strain OY26 / ATCC MYA-4695 / CBS 11777 / NBRC 106824 / NRRL Y48691) TaxID=653667 RepID=S9W1P3_SCHCR|nr:F-box protein Pof11 [Schizosaccharomyces cryophilus OY26]EPY51935.1 F-box protein Pof11 [Schizosaccharomyces cryophilus OY26]
MSDDPKTNYSKIESQNELGIKVSEQKDSFDNEKGNPSSSFTPLESEKIDIIQHTLSELPKEGILLIYNYIQTLLFKDFTDFFPEEIILRIFSYLGQNDLCRCKLMSRRWKRLLEDPSIWKTLFERKGWQLNPKVVQEFEEWMRIKDQSLSEETFIRIDEHFLGPHGTIFHDRQYVYDSQNRPLLNWAHIYKECARLEANWRRGRFVLCEMQTPTRLGRFSRISTDSVYCVQYDDDFVVSGSKDRLISIWDIHAGALLYFLHGHLGSVLCLQFDRERDLIISGSSDTSILIWSWERRCPIKSLTGHTDNVLGVVLSGNYIISCSRDHTARVWKLDASSAEESCIHVLRGHLASVNSVQYNESTGIIVTASGDRTLRMWDVHSGQCLKIIHAHQRGIACTQYNGKYIVSGSSDTTVRIFEANSGKLLRILQGHEDLIRTLEFDNEKVVSGGYDGTIRVWNFETGELYCVLHNDRRSRVFGLQCDHRRIIACTHNSEILVWRFDYGIDCTFF